jgi:hypothetical protein
MNTHFLTDDPERLAEMETEEKSAKSFGITVEQLRKQRRELGQLLTGPYAGCSRGFALMAEQCRDVERILTAAKEEQPCSRKN